MSGKSAFIKSVVLCLYFEHLGIVIPTASGEITFCNHFTSEINNRGDILNGYSHSMTEITDLKNIVENDADGRQCFAVFDNL